ncbi:hypothetical protein DSO57_1003155 [Entomophthora muscae]|uniref:Uncharacterized protein n=1 Tax=Entomophthora muscae TaxID=34485 RepID=A0ACC2RNG4_9FUNG|nr:hypothetical protein DSO57_1003155 [Entomophthora muscae]
MKPPVAPKTMPASSPDLPTNHTGKLFGIMYITLTSVINTIILAASLWSWGKKSFSYLFKLAPLLGWALPAKNLAHVIPENDGPAGQAWIPERQLWTPSTLMRLDHNWTSTMVSVMVHMKAVLQARVDLASNKDATLKIGTVLLCKFTAPLALDHTIFPCRTKKGPKMPAKSLHSLEDLAHTVDERFVLAYPADSLPLVAPSWEETLPGVAHF